jgi:hypothetical protein
MNRQDSLKLMFVASGEAILSPRLVTGALLPAFSSFLATPTNGPFESEHEDKGDGIAPVFTWLTLGEVKPAGWICEQMLRDLNQGSAGRLDELCHEASSDIFVSHRNSGHAENSTNVANVNWWNGETEGNWRAGVHHAGLLKRR